MILISLRGLEKHAENCHSLVPGMSKYGESQEFSEVGIAVEKNAELPQPMDWDQESTKSTTDFSPTIK